VAQIVNDFTKTWDGQGLPTRENCDMSNPRQRFLWMFTGFAVKGAALPLPTEFYEALSEHICECLGLKIIEVKGVRRIADPKRLPNKPTRKYQVGGNMLNRHEAAGQWVDIDDPDRPVPDTKEIFAQLPHHERSEISDAVLEELGLKNEPPRKIRVSTIAKNLDVTPQQVAEVATAFGVLDLTATSLIERRLADKIATRITG
jgi:hypothetical protein